jgi:hypothetical protein
MNLKDLDVTLPALAKFADNLGEELVDVLSPDT